MGQSHQKRRSVYGNSVIAFTVLLIPTDMAVFGGAKPIISLYRIDVKSQTWIQKENIIIVKVI